MQESAIRSKCQLPAQARAILRGSHPVPFQQPEANPAPKHMLGEPLPLAMKENLGRIF